MTAHPRWSFNISQALCNGTRDFSRGSCSIFPIHRCAGPRPVLNGSAQPARNGVFLYVAYDPLFLSPVPYAVLEIVFCPERRPACREQAISLTRTGALNTGDTTRQTFRRPKQHVQVVWHSKPRRPTRIAPRPALVAGTRDFSRGSCSTFSIHRTILGR